MTMTNSPGAAQARLPEQRGCSAIPRRRVLQAGLLGAGAAAWAMANPISMRVAMAAEPNYAGDVLVVLSLRGGHDGLSAIIPIGDPNYLTARPNIGIPSSSVISLGDPLFALHPAMAPLKPFWDNGTFGAVHAVGQPDETRSHFEAMEAMEKAAPNSSLRTGWLDRAIGLRGMSGSVFQALQMGNSSTTMAFNGDSQELALGSIGDFKLQGTGGSDPEDIAETKRWIDAIKAMNVDAPATIKAPLTAAMGALETAASLAAQTYVPLAPYPDTDLARALRDTAQLIKANIGVQVVALDFDSWDMHENLGRFDDEWGWMRRQLDELSGAMAAFATDLGPKFNSTTLVTMSEFGRRVEENQSGGVDHGHGNSMMLLGGNVNGKQVHGEWPTLAPDKLDNGDLAGKQDYRVVLAEILEKRCNQPNISSVFPGLAGGGRLGVVKA